MSSSKYTVDGFKEYEITKDNVRQESFANIARLRCLMNENPQKMHVNNVIEWISTGVDITVLKDEFGNIRELLKKC